MAPGVPTLGGFRLDVIAHEDSWVAHRLKTEMGLTCPQ